MKIIIAVTGASGSIYAYNLLKHLSQFSTKNMTCDVIFSQTGEEVWKYELRKSTIDTFGFRTYAVNDFFAPPASGSSAYDAMIIIPCSMGTLAKITHGISDNLICRAADVMLKERRKLIVVPREAPYSLSHLKNMMKITQAGAVVFPASPHFYHHPSGKKEIVETVTLRLMEMIGIDSGLKQWGEIKRD